MFAPAARPRLLPEIWQTGAGRNLYLVNDEAVAIRARVGGLAIEMRGGRRYDVEAAVLAVGNFPNEDVAAHRYGNPWSARALAGLDPDAAVLLTGSGLPDGATSAARARVRRSGPGCSAPSAPRLPASR